MRDTAASSLVLPWETDEWSCIFNPDNDIIDTLLLSFEPKLKAVNSTMLMRKLMLLLQRVETTNGFRKASLSRSSFT